ncbi:hypothetical protein F5146DRAFT_1125088 [Armillaria mellea]|nr:hypothetical protein F5146DRAFT_1125088 [Armillaria mellea]
MLSHRCTLSLLYLATLASCITHSYFMVKEPREGAQWSNSAVNVLSWEKGVWDGVTHFDIEMTRLSEDGITYIAYNVPSQPSSPTSLNIYLEDVPTGDDYFMLLINSTHGVMHCLSAKVLYRECYSFVSQFFRHARFVDTDGDGERRTGHNEGVRDDRLRVGRARWCGVWGADRRMEGRRSVVGCCGRVR